MHTVIPNLKRLGLITERTEAEYRRVGVLYTDGKSALPAC
jgi:hypothetical protein